MSRIITLIILCLLGVCANAETVQIDGIYYNLDSNANIAEVTNKGYQTYYYSNSDNILIPSMIVYNGVSYEVTSIGNSAFSRCENIHSIVLPNTIKTIGAGAFTGCSGITSIEIPNSVEEIGDNAFSGCSGLTEIILPNSVMIIGSVAFGDCAKLTSVTLPNSITTISKSLFLRCRSLKEITIPNSVTTIEDSAFQGSGITNINIPNSVNTFGYDALNRCNVFKDCNYLKRVELHCPEVKAMFKGLSSLDEVIIGCEVLSVDNYAFSGCQNLQKVEIYSPEMNYRFEGVSSIRKVVIGEGVKVIGDSAFSGNFKLSELSLPNTLESIGISAFSSCNDLEVLVIPSSVKTLNERAFSGCNLSSVTIEIPIPVNISQDVFYNYNKAILYVPKGSKTAYQSANYWKDFKEIVEYDDESDNSFELSITSKGNGSVTFSGHIISGSTESYTIEEGTSATLTFTPNNGYRIGSLKENNVDVTSSVSNDQYIISNISNNTNVEVTFEAIPPTIYTLSITSSGCGSITYSGNTISGSTESYIIEEGTSPILTIIPNSGYRVESLKLNGVDVTSSISNNTYTLSDINQNTTVSVMFEAIPPTTYTLSISSSGSGFVTYSDNTISGGSKSFSVEEGTSATLTFTPNSDFKIASLIVNNANVTSNISNNQYTISNINKDITVEVTFVNDTPVPDLSQYIHGYSTGGSVIQTNDLINSGSQLNWLFDNKSDVSVTLKSMQLIDGKTGTEGNVMAVGVEVAGGSSVAYSTTIGALGINVPVTCRFRYAYNGHEYSTDAVFKGTSGYTLSISSTGKGSVNYNGTTIREQTSSFDVSSLSSATVSFTPDNGYRIKTVMINGSDVTSQLSNNQYRILTITRNTTVAATFEEVPITYSLSITSSTGGYVSYSDYTINGTTKTYTVNEGASTILTFAPNTGYKIESVKVNGSDVTSSVVDNKYTICNIEGNTEVSVTFKVITYSLDITSTGGGYVTCANTNISGTTKSFTYDYGASVVLTFTPNSGYRIKSIKVNNVDVTSNVTDNKYTISSVNKNTTVEVAFEAIPRYTVSITSSGGGYVTCASTTINGTTKSFTYDEGASATLTFTPNAGYKVESVKVNGSDVTSSIVDSKYTISNIEGNTNVSVTFKIITYSLDITSTGGGYVTCANTTINGTTKSFTYDYGASAVLTFTPNSGYRIKSIKVNNVDVTSNVFDNKYTISTINKNTTVEVTFEEIPRYTLSITSLGGGYVTYSTNTISNAAKAFTLDEGASATLTFTPNSGYQILSLKVNSVDVTSGLNNNQYTINSISQNTTVSVAFGEIPPTTYSLSITSSSGGYVTYSNYTIDGTTKTYTVNEGTSATLTFTPNTGYKVESVKVNGSDVTSSIVDNKYTISNIEGNTNVSVTFKVITYSLDITSTGGGYVTCANTTINGTTKSFTYDEGASAVLAFTPNSGYRIKSVKVNNVDVTSNVSDNKYIISSINKNTTVEVAFEEIPRYTLSITSLGGGYVTYSTHAINNTTKTFTFDEGASPTLAFIQNDGCPIVSLKVNNVDVTSSISNNQYTINNIGQNLSVTVVFGEMPPTTYSLPITSFGGGFVTYSGVTIRGATKIFTVNEDASVLLTFTPDTGYRIKSVSINKKDVTNDVIYNQYKINNISQNTEVVVEFERIAYSLKITSSGKGIVTYSDNTISSGTTETYIVNEGYSALLTLTPNSGYRIGRVEVNGEDVTSMVSEDNYTIDNISQNITVSVTFESIPTHTLIITSLGTGFVVYSNNTVNSTTKSFNVDEGSSVTLEFNTVSGYHVGSLLINNVDVTSGIVGDQYTIENYSQTTTVRVSFEAIPPTTYTLSITSSGEGFVSYSTYEIAEETKTFSISEGTSALLTITPKSGYRVRSLKINGADITPYISNNMYTVSNIQQNITVIVSFEEIPPTTYSLSITSSGNGNVRYSGKNINNSTQNYTINEGAAVFVSFIPNSGCRVKSVSINGEDVINKVVDNQYTINNINQDTKIEVVFEPITYLLTISSLAYGKVLYGEEDVYYAARAFTVNEGSSAELVFQPDNGYRIKLLTVNGTDVTSDVLGNKYTVRNIDKNTTVVVTFEAIPPMTYTLSITSTGNGSVTYSGNTVSGTTKSFTVNEGTSAFLSFTPNSSYQVGSLKVNGVDVTSGISDNQYTINSISGNTTVVVTFEEKVIPDGSMVTYKDVNYRVVSGNEKTVAVANGEYAQSLDIPATIAVNDITLNVRGIENNVMTNNPQLAAVIWNPAVKFDAKVSNPNFLLFVTSADYAPSGIKNVIVNGTANNITLTEADGGNDFCCPKAFAARSISYTHKYSMITGVGECRGWETIALPFNVQKIVHSEKGQIVPFAVWQKGEQQRPFWLYEFTGNGWKEAGAIKAYTPYVISMPNNELYYESSCLNGQVTFSAENVAVEATNSHKVSYNGKAFVPNFSVRESGGYVYALNVKNDWVAYNGSLTEGSHFVQNLRTVHPFEAYMTTENNSRAAFSIFDDDATEVQGVKMLLDQRKIKGVYNLNGQKLDEDNNRKLPAGVYIIDGQKVMVK